MFASVHFNAISFHIIFCCCCCSFVRSVIAAAAACCIFTLQFNFIISCTSDAETKIKERIAQLMCEKEQKIEQKKNERNDEWEEQKKNVAHSICENGSEYAQRIRATASAQHLRRARVPEMFCSHLIQKFINMRSCVVCSVNLWLSQYFHLHFASLHFALSCGFGGPLSSSFSVVFISVAL